MSEDILNEAELDALRALDTPTVCNALEIVVPDRRAVGFTTSALVCRARNYHQWSATPAPRGCAP